MLKPLNKWIRRAVLLPLTTVALVANAQSWLYYSDRLTELPLGLFGLLSYVEPALLVVVAWLLGESMEPQQQLSYALTASC